MLAEGGGTTLSFVSVWPNCQPKYSRNRRTFSCWRTWTGPGQAGLSADRSNFDRTQANPILRQTLNDYDLAIGLGAPAEAAAWIKQRPEEVRSEVLVALQILGDLSRPLGIALQLIDGSHTVSSIALVVPWRAMAVFTLETV